MYFVLHPSFSPSSRPISLTPHSFPPFPPDYYAVTFPPNAEVLDICSSWISHYPEGAKRKRTVGMGMNKAELAKNKQLDEYVVKVRFEHLCLLSLSPSPSFLRFFSRPIKHQASNEKP